MGSMTVRVDAKSVRRKKVITKLVWVIFILLLLVLSITYGVLYVINQKGNFTITLDPNAYEEEKLVVSPRSDFKYTTHKLVVDALEYMDNISETWLPVDIDSEADGPHNGNNYMAYTFYVKNKSADTLSYSVAIDVTTVIRNVDEAIRVAVYRNGNKTVYAKRTPTGDVETGTTPFAADNKVMNELYEGLEADQVDKYTVVIWLEGDDPECLNDLIGGEIKMVMTLGENTLKYER